jgi:histidine ammonia-lyase
LVIAARIRNLLTKSKRLRKRYQSESSEESGVQEVYSIRCAPQILGPIYETIQNAKKIVETEINAVTDNPIIIPEKNILIGGNFHGDYVALEMDKLKIAMTKLSLLSERRINFLLNDTINGILPPFLNTGRLGLDLGFQGLQFVATSTAAENQMLSNPMSIHSIPSNKDNQDIVSMGVNAALSAAQVIHNAFQITAIEVHLLKKAAAYLKIKIFEP